MIEGLSGGSSTPAFPKRGPDAGTMDQVRSTSGQSVPNHAHVDWPAYPLQTPSGGGLRADPVQKQDPAKRTLASGKRDCQTKARSRSPDERTDIRSSRPIDIVF